VTSNRPNLHLFDFAGSRYAFDPVAVRVIRLEVDEAICIQDREREARGTDNIAAGSPDHASGTGSSTERKDLSLGMHREAEVQPISQTVEILVNVTSECNLSCRYCFVKRGQFNYDEIRPRRLSPSSTKRFIEMLPDAFPWADNICIHFYGGEPLLNLPAIEAAVQASKAQRKRISFAITTNGTVADDAVFSTLKEGRFSVILSIDGPAHIHDEFRRTRGNAPTHRKVMQFLERLKAEGIYVRGSSVVRSRWNLGHAVGYLESLPIDAIKAQAVRLPEGDPIGLSKEERKQYFQDLDALADMVIECVRDGREPKDDRFNNRVLQLIRGTRRGSFCGAGRSVFGLGADGTVLPCALMEGIEEMSLGGSDTLEWVERGREWAESHAPREECGRCWALPLCGGGCPVMLSTCGEDECDMVRANCEAVLRIYAAFYDHPWDLLVLAGVV
jgi:uncharacterized protein